MRDWYGKSDQISSKTQISSHNKIILNILSEYNRNGLISSHQRFFAAPVEKFNAVYVQNFFKKR